VNQRTSDTNLLARWTGLALLVFLNLVAVYLLLRGHNLPGGGFIAGLVSALSVLLYGLTTSLAKVEEQLGFDALRLAAWGVALALLAPFFAVAAGRPYFEHFQGYVQLPFWGDVYWGTPLLFDLGVMLLVAGMGIKAIVVLARSTSGADPLSGREKTRYAAEVEEPIEARHRKEDVHGS
jgi:multisubunit Na+/H+ antiporter MnhB subunit